MDAPQTNPTLTSHKSHTGAWVILTIIITLIVAGGGVYAWQYTIQQEKDGEIQRLSEQVGNLNSQISQLQQEKIILTEQISQLQDEKEKQLKVDLDNWQIYTHPLNNWTIKYPEDWHYKEYNQSVGFAPQDFVFDDISESPPHIEWVIYQNPDRISMQDFFNGANKPDYFKDALGGIENVNIDGIESKKFKNVAGITSYTITVIPKGELFVELSDNGDNHQIDGIYEGMLSSIKF